MNATGSRFSVHAGASALLLFWLVCLLAVGMFPVNDSAAFRMNDSDWRAEAISRFLAMTGLVVTATVACLGWTAVFFCPLRFEWSRLAARWTMATGTILLLWATVVALRFLDTRPWF